MLVRSLSQLCLRRGLISSLPGLDTHIVKSLPPRSIHHRLLSTPSGPENFGRCTHAIMRAVPESLVRAVGLAAPPDVALARRQQEQYMRALQDLGVQVTLLPALEHHPDCVYVEDCAVVCDGTALITRPGHPSRRGEVGSIREALRLLKLKLVEMTDPDGTLDGGDVLFTGREFFVGLSKRTNAAGVAALAAAFPVYPCTPIPVPAGTLHLKTLVTMAGPDLLSASEAGPSQEVLKSIQAAGKFQYMTVTVPERPAANCLYVNGTLVHRDSDRCPGGCDVFNNQLRDTPKVALNDSELSKADADLTCCSILIDKTD